MNDAVSTTHSEPGLEPDEPLVFEVDGWPAFPAGVLPHDSVNVDSEDPAAVEGRPRQCVGVRRQDSARCGANAVNGRLLCSMHAGLADPALAAQTRHQRAADARTKAEEELARRSLGTRATIAHVLHREHELLEATLMDLLRKASGGDQKAQALLPAYLNQGLGMPTERVEHDGISSREEVKAASTEELAEIVAQGRKRRLEAVPAPQEQTG